MPHNKNLKSIVDKFFQILDQKQILLDPAEMEKYSKDETEDLVYMPDMVLIPHTVEQVSAIVKIANEYKIPVTTRGGGTGLSGGALPVMGGVVVSTEKLNKIISIDSENLQVTCEAGLITEVLIQACAQKGFNYPIDPSSKGSCYIGGNIAHGSGGPRVVKYGTIRDYVLNLEVVLPNGDILWTGANTIKHSSGYNLTQYFIGSEGTLGIITKAVLKLVPMKKADLLLFASFASNELACAAVSKIFQNGYLPSALEYMEREALDWVIKHENISFQLPNDAQAFLLIEVDGNNMDSLMLDAEGISELLYSLDAKDILLADTAKQKEDLWIMRRKMPTSVKSHSIYKEEDTVVPRAALPQLIKGIKEIGKKYGFKSICYGHAGDGNLHVNILKGDMDAIAWKEKLPEGIEEIFQLTVSLGGNISGEHGIGLVQKRYMHTKYSEVHLNLMRSIKQVFDPNGIMNPGKIF